MKLTKEQEQFIAAVRDTDDNIALNACAGTGKTTTLAAALQEHPKTSALAVAFNKANALDFKEKFPAFVSSMTLNSLGFRIWNKHAGFCKVDSSKTFKILKDIGDVENFSEVMRLVSVAKAAGFVPHGAHQAPIVDKEFRAERMADKDFLEIYGDPDHAVLAQLACLYDITDEPDNDMLRITLLALKKSIKLSFKNVVDFDDQIYMPVVYKAAFPKYNLVVIDEAQDLSHLQHHMIARCVAKRIVLAGDPHQAIYGFRGALSNSMEKLVREFNCRKLPLTVNFRCSKQVIACAQQVVPQITAHENAPEGAVRYSDTLPDEIAKGTAVLCRLNAPLFKLAKSLVANGSTFHVMNKGFEKTLVRTIYNIYGERNIRRVIDRPISSFKTAAENYLESLSTDFAREKAQDKIETIEAIIELTGDTNIKNLCNSIKELFSVDKADVTLSTIHTAKGLEWEHVIYLGPEIVEKFIDQGGKQERNLDYVARTRAKQTLTFIPAEK